MKVSTRLEYYLAKVAGREVDLTGLTPSSPINMTEKLLLEIAERIEALEVSAQSEGGEGTGDGGDGVE